MFVDHDAWPPPPDGAEPDKRSPTMSPGEERVVLALIGIVLATIFLAPFARSSVLAAIVALVRDL